MNTCPKCGYTRKPTDTAPDYECPRCGVVYAKVLQTELPASPELPAPLRPSPSPARQLPEDEEIESFAARLRAESLYPTFRQLVGLFYVVWLVLAALVFAGGVAGTVWGEGPMRFGVLLSATFAALLIVVLARVGREMALMLADLSDAAVRIASKAK